MKTSARTILRKCTKCAVELSPGENWTSGLQASRTYLCRSCNAEKGRRFYAQNKQHVIQTSKKLRSTKRETVQQYWRDWRAKNKDRLLVHEAKRRDRVLSNIEGRASRMFSACQARCKMAGIEFNLSREWIAERLLHGHCEVTGLPFDMSLPPRSERKSRTPAFAPSFDRIKCGGGYTTDNVRVTVFIYNVAKSDFSDTELLTLAKALTAKV